MSMTTRMAILGAAVLLTGCQTSGMSQTVVPTPMPGAAAAPMTSSPSEAQGFQQWVTAFRAEAAGRGISQATLASAFDTAQFLPKVIDSDQSQAEFTKSIWT